MTGFVAFMGWAAIAVCSILGLAGFLWLLLDVLLEWLWSRFKWAAEYWRFAIDRAVRRGEYTSGYHNHIRDLRQQWEREREIKMEPEA